MDAQTDRYYLPNLAEGSATDIRNGVVLGYWVDSPGGTTYIYGVDSNELNCSGIITEVQYCYRTTSSALDESALAFTLSVLSQDGTEFRVVDTINIRTTPTDSICASILFGLIYYCCDNTSLQMEDQFQLHSPNFAYSISIPASSSITLLGHRASSFPHLIVEQYVTTVSLNIGQSYVFTSSDPKSNQTLRLFRFALRKLGFSILLLF